MDTNRLKQFRTVVQTGNLRKAASFLGISHSGLSKSMKTLEQEVGFRLLLPHGRGIVVTDQGKGLYERSGPFLEELERVLGSKARGPLPLNRVRVGSFEVFTSYFMGELVEHHLGDSQVDVHELRPGRLEEALLLNQIDVGITYEPLPRPGIEYASIARIPMGAYAKKGAFPGKTAADVPFVAPITPLEGTPSGVRGLDGWPDENFPRTITYRVDLMTTGLSMVSHGKCAIFIPRFIAYLHNQSVRPELAIERLEHSRKFGDVKREIFLVTRESTEENRSIRKIAQAIRKICALSV